MTLICFLAIDCPIVTLHVYFPASSTAIWFIIKYSPLILNFSPFCNLFAFLIQLIWWFEYSEALDSTIHRMIALVPASNIGVSGWNVINGCSKVWKTILEKKYLKIIKLKII